MKRYLYRGLLVFIVASASAVAGAAGPLADRAESHQAATNAHSLFLDAAERVNAVDTFIDLVTIRGASGQEQAIRAELQHRLAATGAALVRLKGAESNAPCNLIMEIPGTGSLAGQPAVVLNAHIDTISRSNPERLAFDPGTGDFFHLDEKESGRSSSFGGDDRSAVAVIVEAVRVLRAGHWTNGVGHRPLVLAFTAGEERGCVGAKHLAEHEPQLFESVAITLAMDGPLDFRTEYPKLAFVAVVSEADAGVVPYQKVLGLMGSLCARTRTNYARTEVGLGMGDFGAFPASAHSGLHLRSPVRGFHATERVKVQDLVNHIDLVCFLVLGWDKADDTGKLSSGW